VIFLLDGDVILFKIFLNYGKGRVSNHIPYQSPFFSLAFKIVIKKGKNIKNLILNGNQPTSRVRCTQCVLEFQSDHAQWR